MEMNESELEKVLGGANPEVIPELKNNNSSNELSEDELANALGGAPKEVIQNKVLDNPTLYRPRSVSEIEKEKQELLRQREEALKRAYGGR